METWRIVPFCAAYEISDHGTLRRAVDCPKTGKKAGHVIKPEPRRGSLIYNLSLNGKRERRLVHRLVMEVFGEPAPSPRHIVAHNDGDHTNNCIGNLRWATYKENTADRIAHGTDHRGSQCYQALLNESAIAYILAHPRYRGAITEMANHFGVDRTTISKIVNGKSWRHVTPPKDCLPT